jgi:hypothetical protein
MPRIFQPVPKTVEISIQGTYDGQLVENKFYAQALETITSSMVDALATVGEDWVVAHFLPLVLSNYVHSRTVARDLSVEASFESIDASAAGSTGTLTGSSAFPGSATVAIHRATGLSGKKAKSRIYHIGLNSGEAPLGNVLGSGVGVVLINLYEALRTAILADSSATWTYGYPQRIVDHVKLTTANFIPVFGHSLTDQFVDSQRRRLTGRGR